MNRGTRRRGQPLAMLGLLLAGWVGIRAAVWDRLIPPDEQTEAIGSAEPALIAAEAAGPLFEGARPRPHARTQWAVVSRPAHADPNLRLERASFVTVGPVAHEAATASAWPLAARVKTTPSATSIATVTPRARGEPQIMPSLGLSPSLLHSPATGSIAPNGWGASGHPARASAGPGPLLVARLRWSGDAWILWRQGQGSVATAPGIASYGASQAGAVLRYAVSPGSAFAPQAHVRLSRALGELDEGEAAAGLSLRPFASVPVRLIGEARVQRSFGRTRVRPAASVVTELSPRRLPFDAEAELYAQAGVVGGALGGGGLGGDEGATPFFDAQLSALRPLLSGGPAELRIGAGAWAGGQEGVARLDLGPRASVLLRLGAASSRFALDWRFRVAGNAAPGSGPALTVSAGF